MLAVPAANPFPWSPDTFPEFFIDETHSFTAFATAHTVFTFLSPSPLLYKFVSLLTFFKYFNFKLIAGGTEISKIKLL